MKKRILVLLAVLMLFPLICAYTYNEQRVFDKASLLTEDEITQLETQVANEIENLQCDIVILTVDDAEGKTAMNYAETFYVDNECGYDKALGTGVVFIIDMDNRKIWITTSGDAITYIDDARIDKMLDYVYDDTHNGNYYDAIEGFLSQVEYYMWNSDFDSNYTPDSDTSYVSDEDSNSWFVSHTGNENVDNFLEKATKYLVWEILAAAVLAGVGIAILAGMNRSKMTVNNHTYLDNNGVIIHEQSDVYTHTTQVRTKVNSNSNGGGGGGSSVHSGGGGGSFGGGGRSF